MPEPTPTPTWRLARYRDGDEHAVLDLFRTVFGRARSLEHWTWQFKANPYGGPFVSMARRLTDDAVVGSYSVMPVKLNLMGKPVLACQSVDTAVHPDHRGQRIFEATATDCYAWCMDQKIEAVVGFPNASSYPGFMRSMGWKRIVFPTQHVLRLGIRNAVQTALGLPVLPWLAEWPYRAVRRGRLEAQRAALRRLTRGVTFRVEDRVPAGYEALWNAWRSQEVLSIWKDSAYLQWRYDGNPDHRFTYYSLVRGDQVTAMAVGVDLDQVLTLCELIVGARDVRMGQRLIAEIAARALSENQRSVSFLGADAGFYDDVFAGFGHARSYSNVFGGRAFKPGPLEESLPHPQNWTVTFGDGDFV
jgi:hypothetical protein